MHGHGEPLVLDHDARHVVEPFLQGGGGPLEAGHGGQGRVVLPVLPVGADQLEAVASDVPQSRETDAGLHIGEVPPGDDGDGALARQRGQHRRRAVEKRGGCGIVHDLGERAVEVEKDHGPAFAEQCGQLLERG